MPFDRTNTTQLAALKTELDTDPQNIGYASETNTQAILDLINIAANNTTGANVSRPIEDLKVSEIAGVVSDAEYLVLAEYNKAWVQSLINRDDDTNLTAYKDKFLAVFGAGSATRTAAQALLVVAASRAEEMFGYGTVLVRDDILAARNS